MKMGNRILSVVITDIILGSMFYMWQFMGLAGAGNVFGALVVLMFVVVLLAIPCDGFPKIPMPKAIQIIGDTFDVILVIAMVWQGLILLPLLFFIAWAIVVTNR